MAPKARNKISDSVLSVRKDTPLNWPADVPNDDSIPWPSIRLRPVTPVANLREWPGLLTVSQQEVVIDTLLAEKIDEQLVDDLPFPKKLRSILRRRIREQGKTTKRKVKEWINNGLPLADYEGERQWRAITEEVPKGWKTGNDEPFCNALTRHGPAVLQRPEVREVVEGWFAAKNGRFPLAFRKRQMQQLARIGPALAKVDRGPIGMPEEERKENIRKSNKKAKQKYDKAVIPELKALEDRINRKMRALPDEVLSDRDAYKLQLSIIAPPILEELRKSDSPHKKEAVKRFLKKVELSPAKARPALK